MNGSSLYRGTVPAQSEDHHIHHHFLPSFLPLTHDLNHPTNTFKMDFASLMSSQIAAAKPTDKGSGKKYLKRSEVEAQREADYNREQEELEKARVERVEKKRKRDEEEAEVKRVREEKKRRLAEESKKRAEDEKLEEERERRKRLGLPGLPEKTEDGENGGMDGQDDIGEEAVLEKLRDLGEPRRLFGETHTDRVRRYKKLMEKALAPKLSDGPIPTTLALLPEAEMKVPETVPQDTDAQKYLHRQIASYFDMLLSEWAFALSRRAKEVKESLSGKQAQNNYISARDSLKPLFAKLESGNLSTILLKAVNEIVHLAQLKRYVHANDAYLRLSIGKAAWPIGVTMVGIHERSAREKLHGGDQEAHIMSDEETRKMLQGIKRCLSFAQTRWPPEDRGQIMG